MDPESTTVPGLQEICHVSYQYPGQSPISNGSNTIEFASISLTHTANSNIFYRSENATKSVSFGAKGNIV
jgi:hypothetical protein